MEDNSLKDVVKKIIGDLEKKETEEQNLLKIWRGSIDERAVEHTRPVSFKAKKLIVNVSDSTWLYKLTLEKENIIKKFNRQIDTKRKIKEVRFRIGEV